MKKFLKYTLAVIVGSLVSVGILMIGFIIMVGIFAAAGQEEVTVKDNSLLVLKLDGPIVERTPDDPFAQIMSEFTGEAAPIGLNKILASIKKASRDKRIKGIYLESGVIMAGHATIEEIRNALLEFKEKSGKFVISFAPVYSQKSYYLATAADKIYLPPAGMLQFQGLSSQRTFFKGTLEKLGVEMQVFRHGQFKSAVEPFTRTEMSEAARLQTQTYVQSMWDHIAAKVAKERNLSTEALNTTANKAPWLQPDEFLVEAGLLDELKYKDQVLKELKDSVSIDYSKDLNSIDISKYAKAYVPDDKRGISKNKIAVIYAQGAIDSGQEGINSEDLSRTIRQARRDSSIDAVVLRINSPGGSGMGSEIIWREVKLTTETKPLIVSMGDLAASGGYYIAAPADAIVAHPNTLTGSIGVFGLIPNVKGLLNKVGITTDGVKTNKFSDLPSIDRPFRPEEKELMQAYIENFYDVFLQRCAEGRSTTKAAIDEIGQGRVWSGENAIDINLVDVLGGIDTALEIAAEKADIKDDYRVVELPKLLSPFEQLMKDLTGNASAFMKNIIWGQSEYLEILNTVESLKESYPIQARVPYEISVN
ncbi:signal peptide peptidase SppA [Marinilabilia rubra]|uniref:Signal peptide peptidase SppA n=1 Tax=Marinilabilia rubra TaxID=2162893 RepID=A0A2U2BBK7_9BACT|nr:signal peptide peptidase SppA [Marinilabilia rubra]PWE00413.1 signal peptide peptidase SppA [Marinilabilia rubra]